MAAADAYTTHEDTPLTIGAAAGVLLNDTDVDGDLLEAQLVSGVAHGTLTLLPEGGFTYTPNANFFGEDGFQYQSSAGAEASEIVAVNITVVAVNDALTAEPDAYITNEDTSLTIAAAGVLLNDTDVDGDLLEAELVSGVAHGSLTLLPEGGFTYTPNANFFGEDGFQYQASAGAEVSEIVAVSITVVSVNDAPTAAPEGYALAEDQDLLSLAANGVLLNDGDTEDDVLSASLAEAPSFAAAFTLYADGSFYYKPQANYFGTDSFKYAPYDGSAYGAPASVTLAVSNVNDTPIFENLSRSVNEDGVLTVTASDVDSSVFSYTTVTAPASGTLQIGGNSIQYLPSANYHGADSFTITASDGLLTTGAVTFSITVLPVNDAPEFTGAALAVTAGETFVYTFNATDVDGDALTYALATPPANGPATVSTAGVLYYEPKGCSLTDSLQVTADDGAATAAATFALDINAAAPATAYTVTAREGSTQRPLILQGKNFGAAAQVTTAAGAFSVIRQSNCNLTADFPADLTAGTHSIYLDNGAFTAKLLTYTVLPWVNALTPNSLQADEEITLTGHALGEAEGTLWVGGQQADVSDWNNTTVTFQIPFSLAPGAYSVQLTTANGKAANSATLWIETATPMVPGRSHLSAVWTGTEAIYWSGYGGGLYPGGVYPGGERYNPTTDTWLPMSTVNAIPSQSYLAVWTGTQFVTWGGRLQSGAYQGATCVYTPVSDSWLCENLGAMLGYDYAAVWTGKEMMVFGSFVGGLFNPVTRVWTTTSMVGATGRARQAMVWTGEKVLVYGGQKLDYESIGSLDLYDPETDTWSAGPDGYVRQWPQAVWSGEEMLVWGGINGGREFRGQAYNPTTNQWRALAQTNAPTGGVLSQVVWTGEEMLVAGGGDSGNTDYTYGSGRYNPRTDTWTPMSMTGRPSGRQGNTGLWTGREYLIWGGRSNGTYPQEGARYFPDTDTWLPMSVTLENGGPQ